MPWQIYDEVLQDAKGRIIGKARTYRRPLSKAEREACTKFLQGITRCRDDEQEQLKPMPKTNVEKCNIVYLAGKIQSLRVGDDDGFFLLDAGPEKKFIPCTIYKSETLAGMLDKFSDGNLIKIVGYVRPWSTKNGDGQWVNHMEVRVTEIKTEAPKRQAQPAPSRRDRSHVDNHNRDSDERSHDDDIPF